MSVGDFLRALFSKLGSTESGGRPILAEVSVSTGLVSTSTNLIKGMRRQLVPLKSSE